MSYERGVPVLQDVDLTVAKSEVVAITGTSGCGKSSLLFVLGLLLRPCNGELLILNRPAQGLPDRDLAHLRANTFGYLFQDAALDARRSVIDNVTEPALYVPGQTRASLRPRAEALLEEFDVRRRSHVRSAKLSGGQVQRIALCRALVLEPSIIIADEPTGNLDDSTGDLVINGLRNRAETGSAVVIATHDERVVRSSDRQIRL